MKRVGKCYQHSPTLHSQFLTCLRERNQPCRIILSRTLKPTLPTLISRVGRSPLNLYQGNPEAALTLGFRLTELKPSIRDLDMHEGLQEIEVAIDCLYEHSNFRSISREMFGTG